MRREGDQPGRMPGQPDDSARKADAEHLRELQKERQARVTKAIIALALAVILVVFIIQNSQRVEAHFVFFTHEARLIWVMFACAVLGGILGFLLGRPGKQVRLHRRKDEPKKG
jgi:uncharacterized integral membrane protein